MTITKKKNKEEEERPITHSPSSPIFADFLLSQLSTLSYSLAHHSKESLNAAVRCAQRPPFLPRWCLVPPSPFANLLPSESRTALNPSLHHRRKEWATAAARHTQGLLSSSFWRSLRKAKKTLAITTAASSGILPRPSILLRLLTRASAAQVIESLSLRGLKLCPLAFLLPPSSSERYVCSVSALGSWLVTRKYFIKTTGAATYNRQVGPG
ncbi:hypothetical protein Ahy_B08g089994 isoform A [Arachis hypogaea]|uniref:Uncharacterized protein n=1 Tax=Arachis hypogaea TaxID=3818 RepID=A0A444XZB2_ARAHY|nr:hypothetical protein Ahy_B08g089994 isoform A [Arachis hypogaea]